MIKIAIVVGHTQSTPGALAVPPLNIYEYEFNKALAGLLAAELHQLGADSEIFFRDNVGVIGAYEGVNSYEPNCALELHFNAAPDARAEGTETLYSTKNDKNAALAAVVQKSMVRAMGLRDRGTKELNTLDRGFLNVTSALCPSILIEPFFGSNASDCGIAIAKKSDLVVALAQGLVSWASI